MLEGHQVLVRDPSSAELGLEGVLPRQPGLSLLGPCVPLQGIIVQLREALAAPPLLHHAMFQHLEL